MKTNESKQKNTEEIIEKIIIANGKLLYAISKKSDNSKSAYVYIHNGEIYFSNNYYSTADFDDSVEAHVVAKEIFVAHLNTDIKSKMLELKQLETLFASIGMQEHISTPLRIESQRLFGKPEKKKRKPTPRELVTASEPICLDDEAE